MQLTTPSILNLRPMPGNHCSLSILITLFKSGSWIRKAQIAFILYLIVVNVSVFLTVIGSPREYCALNGALYVECSTLRLSKLFKSLINYVSLHLHGPQEQMLSTRVAIFAFLLGMGRVVYIY